MKKFTSITLLVVLVIAVFGITGCEPSEQAKTEAAIQQAVAKQDALYNETEPIPLYNYSLPRHMWIQFYNATTTRVVRTWSVEVSYGGNPLSEVQETIGYPIPMDTQLTNPHKLTAQYTGSEGGSDNYWVEGSLEQAEPNGLYTSPNTNATIYFVVGEDDQVAPCYSETNVVCKPFPFHWDNELQIFVRDDNAPATLSIDTEGAEK